MPSVFTIQGTEDRCKRVKNKRTGCTIEVCKVGRRWKFQKNTSICPTLKSGRRKRKR